MDEKQAAEAVARRAQIQFYTPSRESYRIGRIIGYCGVAQVHIELSDGEKIWWRADLAELGQPEPEPAVDDFIRARLDELEGMARESIRFGQQSEGGKEGVLSFRWVQMLRVGTIQTHPMLVIDPEWVIGDVQSRRKLLELHRPSTDHRGGHDPYCVGCWEAGGLDGAPSWPCRTVWLLASAWESHPEFRDDWKTLT